MDAECQLGDKFKSGDLTDLNVTAHVFCDYNWAIIYILAVLELWLSSQSYTLL